MKQILYLVAVVMILTSGLSVRDYNPITINEVYAKTTVSHDDFKKSSWIIGPKYFDDNADTAKIRMFYNQSGTNFYRIYNRITNFEWSFYDSATYNDGSEADFVKID